MIKIWCESCCGHGVNYIADYDYEENHCGDIEYRCDECEGKGYIEYEATLYDLKLGLALHEALSNGYIPVHQGQNIYRINFNIGTTNQSSIELLDWYREKKNK